MTSGFRYPPEADAKLHVLMDYWGIVSETALMARLNIGSRTLRAQREEGGLSAVMEDALGRLCGFSTDWPEWRSGSAGEFAQRFLAERERENRMRQQSQLLRRMRAVADSSSDKFKDLLKAGGLNPAKDLRFQDWSDVSFASEDLSGCDFMGARLLRCDFTDARIAHTNLERAVLRMAGDTAPLQTDLTRAADWQKFRRRKRTHFKIGDAHLREGMVFWDSATASDMVVAPPSHAIVKTTEIDRFKISQPFAVSVQQIEHHELGRRVDSLFRLGLIEPRGQQTIIRNDGHHTFVTLPIAISYVKWLSIITGAPYRLLSEMEWAYCTQFGHTFGTNVGDTTQEYFGARVRTTPPRNQKTRSMLIGWTEADAVRDASDERLAPLWVARTLGETLSDNASDPAMHSYLRGATKFSKVVKGVP